MRLRPSYPSTLAAVAACVLVGCASAPPGDGAKPATEVVVYSPGQLYDLRYEVVSHIWADSWRTAFWSPTYSSQDEALSALRTEAARVGADGLVYVNCLDQGRSKWSLSSGPAVLCYGNAIRIRRKDS